jgi:CrcB protein
MHEQPRPAGLIAGRGDLLLCVSAGGALGSLARWSLGELAASSSTAFPLATFVENLTGALLLGVLMVLLVELLSSTRYVRPFLGVGVLGGYTTFSTYMLDAHTLLAEDRPVLAGAYLAGTLVGGVLATITGIILGRVAVRALVALDRGRRRRVGHERQEH